MNDNNGDAQRGFKTLMTIFVKDTDYIGILAGVGMGGGLIFIGIYLMGAI